MSNDKYPFRVLRETAEQRAVFNWWIGLEHHKGERADLRRCQSGEEALGRLGTFRLRHRLPESLRVSAHAVAAVSSVLAHIKIPAALLVLTDGDAQFDKMMADSTQSLATQLGEEAEKGAGRAVFSELRFQRLNQAASQDIDQDFDVQMRRAVRQAQSKSAAINPVIVADLVFYRYRALNNPDAYQGNRKFEFLFAKDYYQQVFTYQKD